MTEQATIEENDEEPPADDFETARLSEPALAEDWNRPEEDMAWSSLQADREFRSDSCHTKVD